jgi:ABC-type nitrate/sulfonate/bicarbonate transport system substrate-binding protein
MKEMTEQHQLSDGVMSRRRLLELGCLATIGLGIPLAGCGSSSSSGGGGGASTGSGAAAKTTPLGELKYSFSWLDDVTQAGPYISATKGYYKQVGFSSFKFIPGGPSAVPTLTQLSNGTANFGVSGAQEVAEANGNGASFRVIGAQYQKTPTCIVSLATKPLNTPASLRGKTIGVADSDKPALLAFLAINKLTSSDLKLVPFQYDPAPLIDGQMDGFLGYSTDSPISLEEEGHKPAVLMFADFGYATVAQTYVASTQQISSSRELLKAALRADIMGWRVNAVNPKLGAELAVDKFGKSLKYSLANQWATNKAEVKLMKTPDTEKNGLLTVTPELQQKTVKTLALTGAKTTVADEFDMSLLNEVYQEHPELKSLPS